MSSEGSLSDLRNEAARIRASWYVAPRPPAPRGWLVFSEDFVLRILQGCYGRPEAVRRTAGWVALAGLVRGAMAVAQALIMLLAMIPLVSMAVATTAFIMPRGSLGFFVRACYWKTRLRSLGQDTLIDRCVDIWGPRVVEIGSACHIDTFARLVAGEASQGQGGSITIGDYTHIGPRTNIAGRGGVSIGSFVSVQALVHIYSATTTLLDPRRPGQLLSMSHMPPPDLQQISSGPVRVGDYASLGFASLVLPGASVGMGAIVHPYTQVGSAFPDFANISGPGRARQSGWRRPPRIDPRMLAVAPDTHTAAAERTHTSVDAVEDAAR